MVTETAVNLCGQPASSRSSASAKAHQARGRDAPGGDERIPSVEFMWNKFSTGDISR